MGQSQWPSMWARPARGWLTGRLGTLAAMTDHAHDTRAITPEAEQYNATLVKREDDKSDLARFWVRADGVPAHFEPDST